MTQKSHATAERLFRYSLVICVALSGVVLGLYAFLGTQVRMVADDFCSAVAGMAYGPLEGVAIQYMTWNARYTDFFIEYTLAPFHPSVTTWLPALTLVLCFSATLYTLTQAKHFFQLPLQRIHIIAGTILLVFIFYRTMPSYQHAFWFAAQIPYTWGITAIIFYAGTFWQFFKQERSSPSLVIYVIWTAIFMLILGGFTELVLTTLGLLFGFLLLATPLIKHSKRHQYTSVIVTALASLTTALVVVLLSPGVNERRANIAEATEATTSLSVLEALPGGVVNTFVYIFGEPLGITFGQTYAIAYLAILFLVILGWGMLNSHDHKNNELFGTNHASRIFWVTGAIGMSLIFAVIYPSFYAANGAIPMRAVIFARVVQIAMFIVWGYIALLYAQKYNLLSRLRRTATWLPLLIVIAFLLVWTPAVSLYTLARLYPNYQTYAQAWDERHQVLLDTPDGTTITISELAYNIEDSLVLEAPEDDPTFWINNCMARFYNLESLIVVPLDNTD